MQYIFALNAICYTTVLLADGCLIQDKTIQSLPVLVCMWQTCFIFMELLWINNISLASRYCCFCFLVFPPFCKGFKLGVSKLSTRGTMLWIHSSDVSPSHFFSPFFWIACGLSQGLHVVNCIPVECLPLQWFSWGICCFFSRYYWGFLCYCPCYTGLHLDWVC